VNLYTDQELLILSQTHCIRESAIAGLIHLLKQVRTSRAEMKTSAQIGLDTEENIWAYYATLRIERQVLEILARGLDRRD
jgi:hypothetical protein